uniref:calcium/calmodulin-dependent protein kinase n=1 Tax=Globodera rostochiensis TaxID=31243 RepID=A0A914I533_GLORO
MHCPSIVGVGGVSGVSGNSPTNCNANAATAEHKQLTIAHLNVAQMVRQQSDTSSDRLITLRNKLNRSPAFEHSDNHRPTTSAACLDPGELHRPSKLSADNDAIQTNIVGMVDGDNSYIQLNQYRFMEEIAQGSYGIVKLAYSEQDRNLYAMKVLDKLKLVKNYACFKPPPIRKKSANPLQLAVHRNPLQLVQREIAILKKLSHPNVVKLVEVLDDPQDNFLYMVFEYVEKRSLMDLPTDSPLCEYTAWKYFRDALKGLEYLHFQKIVHRDLKPSNLLLSESELVKIADFGVSCEFEGIDAFLTGTAGTPAFMAPEALSENSSQFYSGRAQDIWSLGITLYALVVGNVPFWDKYVIALHKRIKTQPIAFPDSVKMSDGLKELIVGMLRKDPGLRFDIIQIKEHPWLTMDGRRPMPSEEENCHLVEVTEQEVTESIRVMPHLGTLILVKAMGRKKHFGNPFRKFQQNTNSFRSRRKSSSLRTPSTEEATNLLNILKLSSTESATVSPNLRLNGGEMAEKIT